MGLEWDIMATTERAGGGSAPGQERVTLGDSGREGKHSGKDLS